MTVQAPVEGAVRVYRLVPMSEPDPFTWIARKLAHAGWEPIKDNHWIGSATLEEFRWVHLWAIPPNYPALKERREAAKAARQRA